jgi:hypothetical protein
MPSHDDKPLMELKHDPVPGFSTALYITMAAGCAFLLLVFSGLLGVAGGSH